MFKTQDVVYRYRQSDESLSARCPFCSHLNRIAPAVPAECKHERREICSHYVAVYNSVVRFRGLVDAPEIRASEPLEFHSPESDTIRRVAEVPETEDEPRRSIWLIRRGRLVYIAKEIELTTRTPTAERLAAQALLAEQRDRRYYETLERLVRELTEARQYPETEPPELVGKLDALAEHVRGEL